MTNVRLAGLARCCLPGHWFGGAATDGERAARMTSCPTAGRRFAVTEAAGTAGPAPSQASQRRRR